jgi:hypothetical protein
MTLRIIVIDKICQRLPRKGQSVEFSTYVLCIKYRFIIRTRMHPLTEHFPFIAVASKKSDWQILCDLAFERSIVRFLALYSRANHCF